MDTRAALLTPVHSGMPDCQGCSALDQCFIGSLEAVCIDKLQSLVRVRGPIAKGELIYQRGEIFSHIYIVQSGMVKTETESIDGKLNITGFYGFGGLFGLEGIGSERLPGRAVAVQETMLCVLPYAGLLALCEQNPSLNRGFIGRLADRIQNDEYKWKSIRDETGPARVLAFLMELKKGQEQMGNQNDVIELPMSKQDIVGFLGLSPESLSRSLRRLESDRLVQREGAIKLKLLAGASVNNLG